ncbi:hypothetical protein [Streptomyces sp. MMBL 11-1]|uniref:hypothetical protein n=1 Tax=Streptomyces sp. MMBL 11-1 TaxID=3026420 RepID=UPI00235E02EA|nr:hypothetical protein [Streptomyces sp. MMBL 11-1]
MSSTPTSADPAVTALRIALEQAGHDLAEVLFQRVELENQSHYVVVRYNPLDAEKFKREEEMSTSYSETLQQAGWQAALDLGSLVLVPNIPPRDTAPDSYIASWSISIDCAINDQGAADQARERQLDTGITEALWDVTDAAGRSTQVLTQDPDLS